MAKNKKRKGVSIKPPTISPLRFIQTKARQLPIHSCYINKDWETQKMAHVTVARAHKNGNLTFAVYLIDVLGFGIKNTFFNYNMTPYEFNGLLDQWGENTIPCKYALAHNLVYGALEFALEYDIQPHKDWKISQYIMEEDTDAIPLIDLEFGENGKPVFVQMMDEEDWNDGEAIDGDGDEDDDFDLDLKETIYRAVDIAYKSAFPSGENEFDLQIKDAHQQLILTEEPIIEENEQLAKFIDTAYFQLYELSKSEDKAKIRKLQKQILGNTEEFPEAPILLNYLANTYFLVGDRDKGLELFKQCVDQFPDYLLGRLFYAFELIQNKQYEMAWETLKCKYQLQELAPEKELFHFQEVYIFYAVVALYLFLEENDLEKAVTYNDLLVAEGYYPMRWKAVQTAVATLSKAKFEVMEKKFGEEFPSFMGQEFNTNLK
jgi:tetratricopeptide (TPR) repeat protein